MGRGVPAHVHAEAILSALQEARPAGLSVTQLMAATERTRAQIHTGLAHLRQVAAARGLPPVTWDRKWGYRLLDDAPDVWIGYERAFFDTVHHRVANFIAGTLLPHQTKPPDDPYLRTVMAQMGAIESTLQLLAKAVVRRHHETLAASWVSGANCGVFAARCLPSCSASLEVGRCPPTSASPGVPFSATSPAGRRPVYSNGSLTIRDGNCSRRRGNCAVR